VTFCSRDILNRVKRNKEKRIHMKNKKTKKTKKTGKKIAITIVVVIVLALAVLYTIKPKQQQITKDVLLDKNMDPKEYIAFIKKNLVSGGPPKDGIPAIDNPKYLTAKEADKIINDNDQVFGIDHDGLVAAYPQDILYHHEIVNEEVPSKEGESEKISITYCPLTGSVIGYKGKNLGVSGALYNSNLVFYDRETDSSYPQILGLAVEGKETGTSLATFPVTVTTWKKWKTAHPDTKVLSRDTGFPRDYDRAPYPGYEDSLRVWFPVAARSNQFHNKELVHGIEYATKNAEGTNGTHMETFALLKEKVKAEKTVTIKTKQRDLTVTYDAVTDSITVTDQEDNHVKSFDVYWFAWFAYHPDTKVIQ
jgi:hypothetical protein